MEGGGVVEVGPYCYRFLYYVSRPDEKGLLFLWMDEWISYDLYPGLSDKESKE